MKVGIGFENKKSAYLSGKKIAEKALRRGNINRPDCVFAFCNGSLDHDEFFRGLQSVVGNKVPIIGGSSIGIITNEYLSYTGNPAGAAVVQSNTIQYTVASIGDLHKGEKQAGRKLAEKLSSHRHGKALFVVYDSVKRPPMNDSPPALNASTPIIEDSWFYNNRIYWVCFYKTKIINIKIKFFN